MKKDLKKVNNLIKTLKSNKEKYQAFLSGDVLKKINEVFKNINELEEAKFEEAINSNLMAEKGEMASIVLKETLQYLVDIKVATTAKPEKPPKKLLSLRADYIRKGKREGALIPINDDFEDNTFLTNIDNLNDAYNKIVELEVEDNSLSIEQAQKQKKEAIEQAKKQKKEAIEIARTKFKEDWSQKNKPVKKFFLISIVLLIVSIVLGCVVAFSLEPKKNMREYEALQTQWDGLLQCENGILKRVTDVVEGVSVLIIPSMHEGKTIVGIDANVFADEKFANITSVMIPSTVEWIGENAFGGCSLPYYDNEGKRINADEEGNISEPGIQIVGIADETDYAPYVYNKKALKHSGSMWIVGRDGNWESAVDVTLRIDKIYNDRYVAIIKSNSKNKKVTVGVADGVFANANVSAVKIEDLKHIGQNAFAGSTIASLTVSGENHDVSTIMMEKLPETAFLGCENLETPIYEVTTNANLIDAGNFTSYNKQKFRIGEEIKLEATTNPGYTWLGWYDGETKVSEGASLTYAFTMGKESKTYTAKWTYYSVTTETNLSEAGTYSSYNNAKVTVGESVTLTATTNAGYTWLGWYDGGTKVSEGTSQSYTFTMGEESKAYTAKWKANEYVLTFNANNGIVAISSQQVTYDSEYTLPTSTRVGYDFAGWYNGETLVENGIWKYLTNLSLVAKWEPKSYKATFVDASSSSHETFKYGIGIPEYKMPFPTKSKHVFAGWYTNTNGKGTLYSTIPSSYNGDITLYAYFVKGSVTVEGCQALAIKKDTIHFNDSPYTQEATMKLNIDVPEEYSLALLEGKLRVAITVNTTAKVQYADVESKYARVESSIYIDSTTVTSSGEAIAPGGGWPWSYVEPIKGPWGIKQFSATKDVSIDSKNDTINIKHKVYFEMDADGQANWANGTPDGYIDCYITSISYYFYSV